MNISITEIGGVKIDVFSDYDGLPVKSQLPEELKERLKTEKQWLWEGYVVKPIKDSLNRDSALPQYVISWE